MTVYRKCTECSKKVLEGTLCKCEIQKKRDRYKRYQALRLMDEEQKKYQEFYNSDDWKRVRDNVISSCIGVDIVEHYRTGQIVQGECVHHIIELNEDWSRRLDKDNLIYLSAKNHRRVHEEYLKGKKEKVKMQELLWELKNKFMNEFGLI